VPEITTYPRATVLSWTERFLTCSRECPHLRFHCDRLLIIMTID